MFLMEKERKEVVIQRLMMTGTGVTLVIKHCYRCWRIGNIMLHKCIAHLHTVSHAFFLIDNHKF